MSGSWRRNDLSAAENVNPIFSFNCTWLIPFNVYSIGSSTVTIFVFYLFNNFNVAYNVVVLPDPVGPLIKTIPLGLLTPSKYKFFSSSENPK